MRPVAGLIHRAMVLRPIMKKLNGDAPQHEELKVVNISTRITVALRINDVNSVQRVTRDYMLKFMI